MCLTTLRSWATKEVGEAELVLQLQHQVEDLRLDGDIKGGDRLVGHDEAGAEREGAGDADALALAAAEGVGESLQELGAQADKSEQLFDAVDALLAVGDAVDEQRFADYVEEGHARVERREWVLEDHLHVAAQRLQLVAREIGDLEHGAVACAEVDLAVGGFKGAHDAAGGGRFAAAALTDEAEGLAAVDAKVDAVDGADLADDALQEALPNREVFAQSFDFQQCLFVLHIGHFSSYSTASVAGCDCSCG